FPSLCRSHVSANSAFLPPKKKPAFTRPNHSTEHSTDHSTERRKSTDQRSTLNTSGFSPLCGSRFATGIMIPFQQPHLSINPNRVNISLTPRRRPHSSH